MKLPLATSATFSGLVPGLDDGPHVELLGAWQLFARMLARNPASTERSRKCNGTMTE